VYTGGATEGDDLMPARLTEARGFECASHHLVMFGGAGGQHGCSIATTLGIKRIIIPRLSSLLSAYGMALADVVREATEPAAFTLTGNRDNDKISARMAELVKSAESDLSSQGFPDERISSETYLNCRYHGSSTQLMIEKPEDGDYEKKFFDEHKREFGFNLSGRDILVDDIRVRAVGKSTSREVRSPYKDFEEVKKREYDAKRFEEKDVFFDGVNGWMKTSVVPLKELKDGDQVRVSLLDE
jgi:5-oxoprolinase (ATP-hydrolysing)